MATWPLEGKSQIDITKGDYHRTLDDVEFLNDTMVEYGLRSVLDASCRSILAADLSLALTRSALAEAAKKFPSLEDDVHIFSTYLYTKLNAKKYVWPLTRHYWR